VSLIDGAFVAASIRQELTTAIAGCTNARPPRLDVLLVGNDAPSAIYVANKQRACSQTGIVSHLHRFDAGISEAELLHAIDTLNRDPTVDGILVQLPLPGHISSTTVMEAIDPSKDVDGFHPLNRGKLLLGDPTAFVPCTPLGICKLLQHYHIPTQGKKVTIVGRSNTVGKPLAVLLMQNTPWANATVTVVHSLSVDIERLCAEADILIAALGKPFFIGPHMVKEGATVIDVGISALASTTPNGKRRIVGDVDFAAVQHKCQWITPVPGGVGPMTIAMLLVNTWQSYQNRI
jgi:methylenetetrahydrofolate dehydrogenase (NADP+)/methenyltetrahydrofolate cyclohydrolase